MGDNNHLDDADIGERFRFFLAHGGAECFSPGPRAMALAVAERAAEQGSYVYHWELAPSAEDATWLTGIQADDYAVGLLERYRVTLCRRSLGHDWPLEVRSVLVYAGGDPVVRRVCEAELALAAFAAMRQPRTPEDAAGEMALDEIEKWA